MKPRSNNLWSEIKRDSKLTRFINTHYLVMGISLLTLFGIYFFYYQATNIGLLWWDAGQYQSLSSRILFEGGPFRAEGDPLRGYFYPTLLAVFQFLGSVVALPPEVSTFLLQLAGYLGVMTFLVKSTRFNHVELKTKLLILVLSLNVFIAPYFSVSLTDSLYTSMALGLIFWSWTQLTKSTNLSIWPGIFFFSAALAIRPAALWLLPPLIFTIVALLRTNTNINLRRELPLWFLSAAPLLWQSAVNLRNFGQFTPLPISDLGGSQIQWGIGNVKYATWTGDGSAANYYPSTSLVGEYDGGGLSWYLTNPIDSLQLLYFKFVGAFDFDYLVPYPNTGYGLSWLTTTISFLILLTSLFVIIRHTLGLSKSSALGPRWFPATILIAWGALNLITALELRFTLPILTYLGLLSLWFPSEFLSLTRRARLIIALLIIAGLSILWVSALFVRTLAVSGAIS